MNDQDLTSGVQDFFSDDNAAPNRVSGTIGGLGVWILHLVVFAFAVYSGYHGISATARYHADNGLGLMAGVVGILVIEVVLIGLYLAFFTRRITGSAQQFAAGATALLGFTLSCLGIVGDSQMQAGLDVSNWLSIYLTWGLPIAPAFMALGAAVVMGTEPKHLRLMAQSVKHEEFEQTRHDKRIAAMNANLRVAQELANMQLNAKKDAAMYLLASYRSPDVQRHIQASALANMPDLMRSIGVNLPHGTIIEGEAIPMPAPTPEEAAPAEPPARRGIVERLFGNREAAQPSGDDLAAHDEPLNDEAMLAFVQRMIAEGKLVVPVAGSSKPNGAPPPVVGGGSHGATPDFH